MGGSYVVEKLVGGLLFILGFFAAVLAAMVKSDNFLTALLIIASGVIILLLANIGASLNSKNARNEG